MAAAAAAEDGWMPVEDNRLLAVERDRPEGAPEQFLEPLHGAEDVVGVQLVVEVFPFDEGTPRPVRPPSPFIRPPWAREANGLPGSPDRPLKPASPGYRKLAFGYPKNERDEASGFEGSNFEGSNFEGSNFEGSNGREGLDLSLFLSAAFCTEEDFSCAVWSLEDLRPASPAWRADRVAGLKPGRLNPGKKGLDRPAMPASPGKERKGLRGLLDDEVEVEELEAVVVFDVDEEDVAGEEETAAFICSMNIFIPGMPARRLGLKAARAEGLRGDPGKGKDEGEDEEGFCPCRA